MHSVYVNFCFLFSSWKHVFVQGSVAAGINGTASMALWGARGILQKKKNREEQRACSCGGSVIPPSTSPSLVPYSFCASTSWLLFLVSFFLSTSARILLSFHLVMHLAFFVALMQGISHSADQPVGEVAFSSGLQLSHLAVGRDVELHVEHHKRAMVMTGSLHGARKERSQAKGSQHASWYHCQPNPPPPPQANSAEGRRCLRPDTWPNVSLKLSLGSRFGLFFLLAHKANHVDTKLFAHLGNAKWMLAVQPFWALTVVEDVRILGTCLTVVACGWEK